MSIDEKIAEYKADIEECELVRTTTVIKSIREVATKKADDCKQMVEWLEELKKLKAEHETVKAMRADIMNLQTYKLFEGEEDVYVERDEVMKIFDKYTVGGKGNGDNN